MESSTELEARWLRRALVALLCVEGALLVASIPYHSPHVDEAWFAEEAYFQARDGYPHSNFFRGFVHEDVRVVVHHWLFITAQSVVFRVVGFGLPAARALSIAAGLVLLGAMALHGRRAGASPNRLLLAPLIFLLTPQAFRSINLARPEMLVTLFGFASFALLWQEARAPSWRLAIAAGGCAGAAMLTHLNGAIFVGTGAALLVWSRRPGRAAAFAASAAIAVSPYALEAWTHLDLFREQLNSPLIAYKTRAGLLQPLLNLLHEHSRLFLKPDIIFLSSLFVLCAALCWHRRREEERFLFRYLLILMLALGALVADKGILYSVCLVPFEALAIAAALARWRELVAGPFARALLASGIALFAGWGLLAQARDVGDKIDIVALNREIGDRLPAQAWTAAPMAMAFNELERHLLLANHLLTKQTGAQATFAELARYCRARGASQVVLYRREGRLEDLALEPGPRDQLFTTLRDDPRYLILQLR